MAKPRTIADAIEDWSDAIRASEPAASHDVSSIIMDRDALFHYGRHWPLAVIDRRPNGSVRAVYVNSNRCTKSGGFGYCTNSVQRDVLLACRSKASYAGVPVREVPMGDAYISDPTIRVRPSEEDPEPSTDFDLDIPPYFFAPDPGPEPVKDAEGCVAGRTEEYVYAEDARHYLVGPLKSRAAHLRGHPRGLSEQGTNWDHVTYRVWRTGVIKWVEPSPWQTHPSSATDERKSCPHCLDFNRRHNKWSSRFHGRKGFKAYSEWMDHFGSEAAWRDARRDRVRVTRANRKAHAEWLERNTIPQSALSPMRLRSVMAYVPKLDDDGYPLVKDVERHYRLQRQAERMDRRRAREAEEQARYQRQLERFEQSIKRRRKPTFERIAHELASDLATVREAIITTNERQSAHA